MRVNDPSAGSPTETLLRLLLPLSEEGEPNLTQDPARTTFNSKHEGGTGFNSSPAPPSLVLKVEQALYVPGTSCWLGTTSLIEGRFHLQQTNEGGTCSDECEPCTTFNSIEETC